MRKDILLICSFISNPDDATITPVAAGSAVEVAHLYSFLPSAQTTTQQNSPSIHY